MRYFALACDYDGTLAFEGRVAPETVAPSSVGVRLGDASSTSCGRGPGARTGSWLMRRTTSCPPPGGLRRRSSPPPCLGCC